MRRTSQGHGDECGQGLGLRARVSLAIRCLGSRSLVVSRPAAKLTVAQVPVPVLDIRCARLEKRRRRQRPGHAFVATLDSPMALTPSLRGPIAALTHNYCSSLILLQILRYQK